MQSVASLPPKYLVMTFDLWNIDTVHPLIMGKHAKFDQNTLKRFLNIMSTILFSYFPIMNLTSDPENQ